MNIGPYQLNNNLILAPMAGVTDRPFRMLCTKMGAGLTVSEMVTSNEKCWSSTKTRLRLDHTGESEPRSVQIAGSDPIKMANAARFNVDKGAQIIDINMGCPAKKVCNVQAGSALLKNENLVKEIIESVVSSVTVPVTLKIRTGWNTDNKNAVTIAKIAEHAGIQALAIHGRTRECAFKGQAEYETIAEVKSKLSIPVIANGDINSPEKADSVLQKTNADALMIGRAAQGNPWIFNEINYFLENRKKIAKKSDKELAELLIDHLKTLYHFYGEKKGVRIARKHIGWYCKQTENTEIFQRKIYQIEEANKQLNMVREFFSLSNHWRLLTA